MIRNEDERKQAVARLTELHLQLSDQPRQLQILGLSDQQIEHRLANLKQTCQHLEDEIAKFGRLTACTWVPAL